MVNIKGLTKGNSIPSLITGLVAANSILVGSGGTGFSNIPQSIANIAARVVGPFNAGGISSSQPQTVVGSPGFRFQLKQELITGVSLLAVDYVLGEVKAARGIKGVSMVRRFILKPVGSGLVLAGIVNIVLGDPSPNNGRPTFAANIGRAGNYPVVGIRGAGMGAL